MVALPREGNTGSFVFSIFIDPYQVIQAIGQMLKADGFFVRMYSV